MKSVIENGTKKYLAKFIGDPQWLPTTQIFHERFVKNHIYKVFKMKNGSIIVQGLLESESGKKAKGRRVYYTSQAQFLKNNFKYCK